MKICIAGAGIVGCVAALALRQRGYEVVVCEAVSELQPLGVGVNLLPHAMQILEGLGVGPALEAAGVATRELSYFNRHGQRLWTEPRGRFAGYTAPQVSIHRGALQMTLVRETLRHLGSERVKTGLRFESVSGEGPVTAVFRTPAGERISVEADALLGADGIHSALRALRYPDEGLPVYGGRILWRAVSRTKPFLSGASMIMAGHPNQKFVAYPISAQDPDGLQTINWIAELSRPNMIERENWNKEGDKADFAPRFADWRFDWLDVPDIIERAERVFEFPLVDRDPLPAWTFGATTLIGDAAHPMYPIGSNGASQGILDVEALMRALNTHADAREAFKVYEAERLPATAAVVKANRGNGPELSMQLAEERAPDGFERLDDIFAEGELEAIAARYKSVAGFSKEAVAALRG